MILGWNAVFLPLRMSGVFAEEMQGDAVQYGTVSPINQTLYPCDCRCVGTFDSYSIVLAFFGCFSISFQCVLFVKNWVKEPQLLAGQVSFERSES